MYFCLICIYIFIGYFPENCFSIHCTDVDDSLNLLKKEETWETLKRAADIRNHNFGNLLVEEGHQLPTTFYHRSCCEHFTMKSSLERINAANIKRLKFLETKLGAIGSFDTYESTCRPNRDLVGRGKNTNIERRMYLL